MTYWREILGLCGLAVLVYLYFRVVRPFAQLREALKRLAERDFRPVLLDSRLGVFRETAGNVRRISELLQEFDQQIANEGFSLRAILSSMVEGVLITDQTQHIRLVNEPLHRMFDIRQSPINRTVMEVFRSHELQQAIELTLRDGVPRQIEILLQNPGTTTGYASSTFEVYASSLSPDRTKAPLGAVVVFHDVSTVKNLEAIRREFVANVSHEFRTPLAIINGYIETLMDGALDDRAMAERSLQVMHKNGQRLTLLIEDLLSLSRLEHRFAQLEFQPFNLHDTLNRVLERLESAIATRGAKITADWPEDARFIEGDSRRIEQVYSNLLENAVRYGADEILIRISARRVGEEVEIVFEDNGPGIPLEDQPHIFERFYRVHKDRSRVAGGTGLGLSIVKHIVQAHGGNVSVESAPGKGAAFKVLLPVSQGGRSDK